MFPCFSNRISQARFLVCVPFCLLFLSIGELGLTPRSDAQARVPPIKRLQRRFPNRPAVTPNPDVLAAQQEIKRVREVMGLYLRQGQKTPYIGEQTTQVIAGGLQSTQIVRHRGPGQERIQFLTPPRMNGEVILTAGDRSFHYLPQKQRIVEGIASQEVFQGHAKDIIAGIRTGRITVKMLGSQIVAGQNTSVVELRTAEGGWRLYIDDRTGVRLKTEQLNAQGNVTSASYFTKIDYTPTFDPKDFRPDTLPRVEHEPGLPPGPPLASVQAAQQQVTYTLREPILPAGFRLMGVWVVERPGDRKITVLRYTDGANTFALFEQPVKPNARPAPLAPAKLQRRALRHWMAGGLQFTLVGSLRPATLEQIVRSLQ